MAHSCFCLVHIEMPLLICSQSWAPPGFQIWWLKQCFHVGNTLRIVTQSSLGSTATRCNPSASVLGNASQELFRRDHECLRAGPVKTRDFFSKCIVEGVSKVHANSDTYIVWGFGGLRQQRPTTSLGLLGHVVLLPIFAHFSPMFANFSRF